METEIKVGDCWSRLHTVKTSRVYYRVVKVYRNIVHYQYLHPVYYIPIQMIHQEHIDRFLSRVNRPQYRREPALIRIKYFGE